MDLPMNCLHPIQVRKVIRQTDKAILVKIGRREERWIPQSVIDDKSEVWKKGQSGELLICFEFAERNGLVR